MGSLEQLEMQPLPSMVHEISYLWIALIKLIEDNLDEIIFMENPLHKKTVKNIVHYHIFSKKLLEN